MRDELKTVGVEDSATREEGMSAPRALSQGLRIGGWLILGSLFGAVLAAAFMAYGQPGLLLEQLNLRYCG